MTEPILSNREIALREFQRARREAAVQQVLARLRGESDTLLRYDDVRRELRAKHPVNRGLREIPLDKIVGSVGRNEDFTRGFMPTSDSNQERWVNVRAAAMDMKALPPIEVYQVGDAYFVQNGNHRVSVARQLGRETIAAYVTEVETRVPFSADDDAEQVICKARYADFLERTNIDTLCPGADLLTTHCGEYRMLLDQIEIECRLLGKDGECKPENWDRAVVRWYQDVYMPIVRIIRDVGLMQRFTGETEADIYLLLSERREALEHASGWRINYETALPELVQKPNRPVLGRVLAALAPGLVEGPAVGVWRGQRVALHREGHLFEHLLVLLEGIDGDWELLDQVVRLAQHDDDHILGLHVVRDGSAVDEAAIQRLRYEFELRCHAAGLRGEFAVEFGNSYRVVARRAAWADIVFTNLTDPPESTPLARMRPGWVGLMRQCPCPIFAFPHSVQSDLDRALLAYDGSDTADEALYLATYSTLRWQRALTVVTVETARAGRTTLDRARAHLERHGVTWAEYVLGAGPVADAILSTAKARDTNLLIVGGIGCRPVWRRLAESAVEQILREFKQPIWICR